MSSESEPAASIRSTAPVRRRCAFESRLHLLAAPSPQGERHVAIQRDPYLVIRAFAKRDIHVPAPTKHHHDRNGNDDNDLNQLLDIKSPSVSKAAFYMGLPLAFKGLVRLCACVERRQQTQLRACTRAPRAPAATDRRERQDKTRRKHRRVRQRPKATAKSPPCAPRYRQALLEILVGI